MNFISRHASRLVIAALFFFSGFSGLIYQVLWMRKFKIVLGSSVFSTSVVVAAFMLGLLVGSWWIGRRLNKVNRFNELKLYGLLELAIGIYAFLFLLFIEHTSFLYGFTFDRQFPISLKMLVNGGITLLLLVLPTSAMGATLPLLVNYFSKEVNNFRSTVSMFYAINTFGGAVAALIAGFYLIKYFGISYSVGIAAVINITIGLTAYLVSRRDKKTPAFPEVTADPSPTARAVGKNISAQLLLAVSFFTGFIAIAYEILWIRCLNYLINNSTYTFSLILFVFLTSIAIGSFLNNYLKKIGNKILFLGITQLLLACCALLSIYIFYDFAYTGYFTEHFIRREGLSINWYDNVGLNLTLTAMIFLLPSLLMGVSFPLISELYFERQEHSSGNAIGRIFVFNTFGSVAGSLLPVFVLIPFLGGIRHALWFVAGVNLLVSLLFFFYLKAGSRLAMISGLAIFLTLFLVTRGNQELYSLEILNEENTSNKSLFYKEGIMATVKVYEEDQYIRSMSIDGVTIASDKFHAKEKQIAHIPFFTDRRIEQVLVVGLASGNTANTMLMHPLKEMDIVEIVPSVLEAIELFSQQNALLEKTDKKHIYIDDVISFLTYSDKKYDLISSDGKFGPLNKANTIMLSADYYELCKTHLTDDGILVQWITCELPHKHFKTILNTIREVFPHSELFLNRKNLFILSSNQPVRIDLQRITGLFNDPVMAADIHQTNIYTPSEFLSMYCGPITEVIEDPEFLSTFDHPVLEYDYATEARRDQEASGTSYFANLTYLSKSLEQYHDYEHFGKVTGQDGRAAHEANLRFVLSRVNYVKAHLLWEKDRKEDAINYFGEVIRINHPDNINDIALSARMTGDYFMQNEQFAKAREYFDKAIHLLPSYQLLYTLRGISSFYLNDLEAARNDFQHALELYPEDQTAIQYLKEVDQRLAVNTIAPAD